MRNHNIIHILIIVFLILILKLPQIWSSNTMLDGDECVVGLMAKHVVEGKELPIYFYGQKYGFSFVETITVSFFYKLFGYSDVSVKAAMLILWIIAVLLFYMALSLIEKKDSKLSLFLTLLLVVSPAWIIWSMKARGGYLTSFLAVSSLFYVCFKNKEQLKITQAVLVGILILVVFESQPLWFPGLFFFMVYFFITNNKYKELLIVVILFLFGFSGLKVYKFRLHSVWSPSVFSTDAQILENIKNLPSNIFQHFTGNYFYDQQLESGILLRLLALMYTGLLFVIIVISLYLIIKKKVYLSYLSISLIAVLFSLFLTFLTTAFHYRYLLPLTGFMIINLFFVLEYVNFQRLVYGICLGLGVFGLVVQFNFNFASPELNYKKDLEKLCRFLGHNEIRSTFCIDPLLQWQIMFYSKEKVYSRCGLNIDRYPEHAHIVNSDLVDPNRKVTLVGFSNQLTVTEVPNLQIFGPYFIFMEPDITTLQKMGFELD